MVDAAGFMIVIEDVDGCGCGCGCGCGWKVWIESLEMVAERV